MTQTRWKFSSLVFSALACCVAAGVVATPSPAFAQDDKEPPKRSQSLDPAVAKVLIEVFELMTAEQFPAALEKLNALVASRGDRMKPFDKATTHELRGSVKVSLEDFRGALRDFQIAVDTNALPIARQNQLRYFIAQLYFQLQDYQSAIRGLNDWIKSSQAAGEKVDTNAYYLLAAAYTQIAPPNYRSARSPAESAVNGAPEPKKNYYDLLNMIYSELADRPKRLALLEKMVGFWPAEKGYWTQLSGEYSGAGRDKEAFAVLEVAYRAGLLSKENEILQLVQYYSFFENPYRGAKMMERELAAGVVKRNRKNLQLLSQLWSQAREHKKAIPILQEAAKLADNGELYYRLGQVLLADEQYAAADRALVNAINKGGMDRDDTGDAWLLLGTARFSQAGPDDVATMNRAREAFVNAQRYGKVSGQAAKWVQYIDAIIATRAAGIEIEKRLIAEQCRDLVKRIEQKRRIDQLRGVESVDSSGVASPEQLAECKLKSDGTPIDAPAPEGETGGGAQVVEESASEQ